MYESYREGEEEREGSGNHGGKERALKTSVSKYILVQWVVSFQSQHFVSTYTNLGESFFRPSVSGKLSMLFFSKCA